MSHYYLIYILHQSRQLDFSVFLLYCLLWSKLNGRHLYILVGSPRYQWPMTIRFTDHYPLTLSWRRSTKTYKLYIRVSTPQKHINISANKSSRSDWGSNPRPTATPPSTKYQLSNPLSQIAILKKNGSLDSGMLGYHIVLYCKLLHIMKASTRAWINSSA
jgi:hypothetical protein